MQFGRKPLFLVSLLVMCGSYILSASLIAGFDLEESEEGFSSTQKAAGYVIVAAFGVASSSAAVSVG